MPTSEDVLKQLAARCVRLRADGAERLPSERALAAQLGASRATVRKAMEVLVAEGTIVVERGRYGGARLVPLGAARPYDPCVRTLGMLAMIRADGRSISRGLNQVAGIPRGQIEQTDAVDNRVLSLALEAADAQVAALLGLEPGVPVASLLRLRFAEGAPLSLERMYLPDERVPRLLDEGFQGVGSMYALLEDRYGISVASAEEEFEVAVASGDVAHLLGIAAGDAVLTLRRLATDAEGLAVECSFDIFRGDRTRLTLRTQSPGAVMTPAGALLDRWEVMLPRGATPKVAVRRATGSHQNVAQRP